MYEPAKTCFTNSFGSTFNIVRQMGKITIKVVEYRRGSNGPMAEICFSKERHPETYSAFNRLARAMAKQEKQKGERKNYGWPSGDSSYTRCSNNSLDYISVTDRGDIVDIQVSGNEDGKRCSDTIAYIRFSAHEVPLIINAFVALAFAIQKDNQSHPVSEVAAW